MENGIDDADVYSERMSRPVELEIRADVAYWINQKFLEQSESSEVIKEPLSKRWIGRIVGGSEKFVIPRTPTVDEMITAIAAQNSFVIVPCILVERERHYSAKSIDLRALKKSMVDEAKRYQGLQKQVKKLEYEVHVMNCLVKGARDIEKVEDIVIFVDYQNFKSRLDSDALVLDEQAMINGICNYYTLGARARHLIRAYIIDAFKTPHRVWHKRQGMEFVEVPRWQPGEENPTDKMIIEKVLSEADSGRIQRDTVICIVTGDADFIPMLRALKEFGFKVMLASFLTNTKPVLRRSPYISIYMDLRTLCYPKPKTEIKESNSPLSEDGIPF